MLHCAYAGSAFGLTWNQLAVKDDILRFRPLPQFLKSLDCPHDGFLQRDSWCLVDVVETERNQHHHRILRETPAAAPLAWDSSSSLYPRVNIQLFTLFSTLLLTHSIRPLLAGLTREASSKFGVVSNFLSLHPNLCYLSD